MHNEPLVTAEMLQNLPEPVQRYLAFTGVVGKPWIRTARVLQAGRFRRGADQPWMRITADQRFTTTPPSFVWNAQFKMAGIPFVQVRDSYQDGRGRMFGKMAGLFTIFNAGGTEIDQGSFMRYLGEMMWFPTAFLSPHVTWQGIDDCRAQVTLTNGGQNPTARMTFDPQGRPIDFTAQRYADFNGIFELHTWSVPLTGYAANAGLTIPTRGLVTWKLPSGDVPYYDWQVTQVEYTHSLPKNGLESA
jgi:hypothetical protein